MSHTSIEPPPPALSRSRFLTLAAWVQGGVVFFAFLIGWAIHLDPLSLIRWDSQSLLFGLLAVVPMFGLYLFSPGLRKLAINSLGESLSQCRWYDLVVLAALAGVGEELLFRGVIYSGLSRINPWLAVIASNVAFGLLHALSRNYFLTTTAIGFAMHYLANATGERNLLAPIVAHGIYDFIAFYLLIREWKKLSPAERTG
ncbi:MAG: CPBP family intramembrane metalloprotease [Planctomycetota bacterium]|jgi:membrane protease YdiL (CAAX protease family)|nr:MAG: CPBP family intramembrane metalloprotease [Planctomycetota bacterium]